MYNPFYFLKLILKKFQKFNLTNVPEKIKVFSVCIQDIVRLGGNICAIMLVFHYVKWANINCQLKHWINFVTLKLQYGQTCHSLTETNFQ